MLDQQVQIEVDRGGTRVSFRKGASANEVAGIVRGFKGEPDVTLTISREGSDQSLLIAISGDKAFLGLDEGTNGVFQFIARDTQTGGTQQLIIGRQKTEIDSRYVLCVETAASVAHEWLTRGRQSSLGLWEPK